MRVNCWGCRVSPGSNAEKAGVKSDDVLISVNNEEVTYFDEIQKSLYDKGKGTNRIVEEKPTLGPWTRFH